MEWPLWMCLSDDSPRFDGRGPDRHVIPWCVFKNINTALLNFVRFSDIQKRMYEIFYSTDVCAARNYGIKRAIVLHDNSNKCTMRR